MAVSGESPLPSSNTAHALFTHMRRRIGRLGVLVAMLSVLLAALLAVLVYVCFILR
jgi:hypothetical protein